MRRRHDLRSRALVSFLADLARPRHAAHGDEELGFDEVDALAYAPAVAEGREAFDVRVDGEGGLVRWVGRLQPAVGVEGFRVWVGGWVAGYGPGGGLVLGLGVCVHCGGGREIGRRCLPLAGVDVSACGEEIAFVDVVFFELVRDAFVTGQCCNLPLGEGRLGQRNLLLGVTGRQRMISLMTARRSGIRGASVVSGMRPPHTVSTSCCSAACHSG